MKLKNLCLVVAITLLFSVSVKLFADCGNCDKAKSSCCEKEAVQKAEVSDEEEIPLAKVPKNIKEIAKKAVKGIKLSEAELEDGNYELEGYVGKDKYEVEITPEGKVIEIELDKKDDDDCVVELGKENPIKIDDKDDDECVIESGKESPVKIDDKDDDECVIESGNDSPISDIIK